MHICGDCCLPDRQFFHANWSIPDAAPAHGATGISCRRRAMFEGQLEDALGAESRARIVDAPSAAHCRARDAPHRRTVAAPRSRFDRERLARIRRRAPTAPCSRHSTGCRRGSGTSACIEGVKPAVVIGRHGGTILFLLPFALETNGFVRKITWLGSCLSNYNGPMVAQRFFAAREPRRNSPRSGGKFNSCCGSSSATT